MGVRNWTRRGKSVSEDEESGSCMATDHFKSGFCRWGGFHKILCEWKKQNKKKVSVISFTKNCFRRKNKQSVCVSWERDTHTHQHGEEWGLLRLSMLSTLHQVTLRVREGGELVTMRVEQGWGRAEVCRVTVIGKSAKDTKQAVTRIKKWPAYA